MKWYYYLHTNGDLIGKNPAVMNDDDFNSPFVKKHWKIETEYRGDLWIMILEALAMGAKIDRVKKLSLKWSYDFKDSVEFLLRYKPNKLMREGLKIFIKEILEMEDEDYWTKAEKIGAEKK